MNPNDLRSRIIPAFVIILLLHLLAPAPPGLAINHETKECSSYWYGDEYAIYVLPKGWVAYDVNNDGLVLTENGSCDYRKGDKECCEELGYRYIEGEIGTIRYTPYTYLLLACRFWFIFPIVIILIILYFLSRKYLDAPRETK